jgi:cytoskeleton protein RodZ
MPSPAPGQAQAAQAPVIEIQRPAPAASPVQAVPQQEAVSRRPTEPANPAALATPPMRTDTQVYARANSWIELRGPDGDILAQTYVRAGETYIVPAGISYRIIVAR